MKRSIATAMAVAAVIVMMGSVGFDRGSGSRLDGTWRMVEPRTPPDVEHIKILARGHFVWMTVDHGKIVRSAGGRYVARGARYMEIIDYTLQDEPDWMVGRELWFTREFDGSKWIHIGAPDGAVQGTEVWERI